MERTGPQELVSRAKALGFPPGDWGDMEGPPQKTGQTELDFQVILQAAMWGVLQKGARVTGGDRAAWTKATAVRAKEERGIQKVFCQI